MLKDTGAGLKRVILTESGTIWASELMTIMDHEPLNKVGISESVIPNKWWRKIASLKIECQLI